MKFQEELACISRLNSARKSNGRMLVMDDLLDGTRTQKDMTPFINRYQNWSYNCDSTSYSNIVGKGPFQISPSGGFCSEGARSTIDFQPGDEINSHLFTEREAVKNNRKIDGRMLHHDDSSRMNQDLTAYEVGDQGAIVMKSGFSIE